MNTAMSNINCSKAIKIISWNCKMAYRTKEQFILKYSPDIVIVPECEYPGDNTSRRLWVGDNHKKGLGVFSYSDFSLKVGNDYNSDCKYILPIQIKNGEKFNLLAVWAMNDTKDVRRRYIGQVRLALNHYETMLNEPTIIIGDFNWNTNWDTKPSYPLYGTLSDTIRFLEKKNIRSAYHSLFSEEFGKETNPTLFMYHNKDKSYHIDYCFASNNFTIIDFQVGTYSDWIAMSDHMPIIISMIKTHEPSNWQ